MATEPKPKVARKKTRRRKPPEQFVDYVVEIESWDWSYWLALNTLRDPPDPYHEHRHLQIKGQTLRPVGLKTDRVEVSLFPTINLEEERRKELNRSRLARSSPTRTGSRRPSESRRTR